MEQSALPWKYDILGLYAMPRMRIWIDYLVPIGTLCGMLYSGCMTGLASISAFLLLRSTVPQCGSYETFMERTWLHSVRDRLICQLSSVLSIPLGGCLRCWPSSLPSKHILSVQGWRIEVKSLNSLPWLRMQVLEASWDISQLLSFVRAGRGFISNV